MPIAVVSDLDVRALEYYDDNCSDRKIPKYWLKETLRPELEKISQCVNYDAMATLFGSKSVFEKEVRLHKKENFNPITETLNRMKDVLTDGNLTTLNEEMLEQIRKEKTEQLESEINADGIKIFLPKAWTLEYEIAASGLYRLLETAIRAAKKEAANQEQEITNEVLKNLWNEVINDYPEGNTPTKEVVYKIFEPLNEGTVSKAITAQYLAGMLAGELPPVSDNIVDREEVKRIIESDEKLKYLVDAINHVTK
jgi:putative ATP-dependent endonuclease of OLD family